MARAATERTYEVSSEFKATPRAIVEAFFDPAALGRWWGASRSVTMPRLLGAFALEWTPSEEVDPVLGRLGGGLHGTVMQYEATRGFFIANLYWLPPDGDPLGPMALDVACALCLTCDGQPATRVTILQTGFDDGPRWRRYYDRLQEGWPRSLEALKGVVEG